MLTKKQAVELLITAVRDAEECSFPMTLEESEMEQYCDVDDLVKRLRDTKPESLMDAFASVCESHEYHGNLEVLVKCALPRLIVNEMYRYAAYDHPVIRHYM